MLPLAIQIVGRITLLLFSVIIGLMTWNLILNGSAHCPIDYFLHDLNYVSILVGSFEQRVMFGRMSSYNALVSTLLFYLVLVVEISRQGIALLLNVTCLTRVFLLISTTICLSWEKGVEMIVLAICVIIQISSYLYFFFYCMNESFRASNLLVFCETWQYFINANEF